jgi:hypothetical protein
MQYSNTKDLDTQLWADEQQGRSVKNDITCPIAINIGIMLII